MGRRGAIIFPQRILFFLSIDSFRYPYEAPAPLRKTKAIVFPYAMIVEYSSDLAPNARNITDPFKKFRLTSASSVVVM